MCSYSYVHKINSCVPGSWLKWSMNVDTKVVFFVPLQHNYYVK